MNCKTIVTREEMLLAAILVPFAILLTVVS